MFFCSISEIGIQTMSKLIVTRAQAEMYGHLLFYAYAYDKQNSKTCELKIINAKHFHITDAIGL